VRRGTSIMIAVLLVLILSAFAIQIQSLAHHH